MTDIEVPAMRRSGTVRLARAAGFGICASGTVLLITLALLHHGTGWPAALCAALATASLTAVMWQRHPARPPVRLTRAGLQLPGAGDEPRALAWADIETATVTGGRLSPRLVVVPADPDGSVDASGARRRAAAPSRTRLPIVVPLGGSRTELARLRTGLAAHLKTELGDVR
ncbi:hypothetical protein [Dactylosporangium matsuzakiense]|uniref:PH domain-containing protein n=1 Tax=Dactylosporangium matsuzakiense TaxID=53360 RepID=A0A9W6NQL1_9ACTN|nr:hypothetical protein [Dactylosporangium matsuzakiense]UWZ41278.1 hypothetical protein Dmats_26765 [Dactylosporangium matsuzakiense]GLL05654.1 hypothetical protein GCM10017581_074010 [Dactylosporangium matsuzakiense]